ncbi:hypothetical protein GGR52DRAFT_564192 [Hypoxylon sp. FL1284]|nr:hypothetical protein GGR52DRAFT_564192 [Hypoxylon sp. FL1284]
MRVRELRRLLLVLVVISSPFLFYTNFLCRHQGPPNSCHQMKNWIGRIFHDSYNIQQQDIVAYQANISNNGSIDRPGSLPTPLVDSNGVNNEDVEDSNGHFVSNLNETHVELFSISTPNKEYFRLNFGDKLAINPNIIPHPLLEDTWIMIAQQYDPLDTTHMQFVELACDAAFDETHSQLRCLFPPTSLPIAPTGLGNCEGELEFFNLNAGPHDARVFYGPRSLFTIYGSNSHETCFGQWIQSFRVLVNWESDAEDGEQGSLFRVGTELRRPAPYSAMEKNWFIFWDADDVMYAHYDIYPRRVFAKLNADGSAGPDIAPQAAAAGDEQCLNEHMPKPGPVHESIHQATNSLSVTLCRQQDSDCSPSDTNTFLLVIFHHKTFHEFHGVYEPYVLLFQRRLPFQLHSISARPLWIHGRERVSETHSQMLYITSISWKTSGQKYHGYIDDVLFLGFGIEDQDAGGIDISTSDLLVGLRLCSEAPGW